MPCEDKKIKYTEMPARKSDTRRPNGTFHRKLRDITTLKKEDLWVPKEAGWLEDTWKDTNKIVKDAANKTQAYYDKGMEKLQGADLGGFLQAPKATVEPGVPTGIMDTAKGMIGTVHNKAADLLPGGQWISNQIQKVVPWSAYQGYKDRWHPLDHNAATNTYTNTPANQYYVPADEQTKEYRAMQDAAKKQEYMESLQQQGYTLDSAGNIAKPLNAPAYDAFQHSALALDPNKYKGMDEYKKAVGENIAAQYKKLSWFEQLTGAGKRWDAMQQAANDTFAYAQMMKKLGNEPAFKVWDARARALQQASIEGRKQADAKLRSYRKPVAWGVGLAAAGIPLMLLMKKMFSGQPRQPQIVINNAQPAPQFTVRGYQGQVMGGR